MTRAWTGSGLSASRHVGQVAATNGAAIAWSLSAAGRAAAAAGRTLASQPQVTAWRTGPAGQTWRGSSSSIGGR